MSVLSLMERVGGDAERRMMRAMLDAMADGRHGAPPDFNSIEYVAAGQWLHWFRGTGKTSAYGPLQQAVNDDANSHALRGFIVVWRMCQAMLDNSPPPN